MLSSISSDNADALVEANTVGIQQVFGGLDVFEKDADLK